MVESSKLNAPGPLDPQPMQPKFKQKACACDARAEWEAKDDSPGDQREDSGAEWAIGERETPQLNLREPRRSRGVALERMTDSDLELVALIWRFLPVLHGMRIKFYPPGEFQISTRLLTGPT